MANARERHRHIRCGIASLPRPLLALVLNRVSSAQRNLVAALVCREWATTLQSECNISVRIVGNREFDPGRVTEELGSFKFIASLDLSDLSSDHFPLSELKGNSSVQWWRSLEQLSLDGCAFEADCEDPATEFPLLTSLTFVDYGSSSAEQWLLEHPGLEYLRVGSPSHGNSTFPDNFGLRLQKLRGLELIEVAIEEFLDSLGEMAQLQQLRLKNVLAALPASLGQLQRLEEIHAQGRLIQLPESITNLRRLKKLCVNDVRSLPRLLGPWLQASLVVFHLRSCPPECIPEDLSACVQLRTVDMRMCLAELQQGWVGCRALRKISLDLTGLKHFSGCVGHLQQLTSFTLKGIRVELPNNIFSKSNTSLVRVTLGSSTLKRLPKSITSLPGLQVLKLSECSSLDGHPAPWNISAWPKFRHLALGSAALQQLPCVGGCGSSLKRVKVWGSSSSAPQVVQFLQYVSGVEALHLGGDALDAYPLRLWGMQQLKHLRLGPGVAIGATGTKRSAAESPRVLVEALPSLTSLQMISLPVTRLQLRQLPALRSLRIMVLEQLQEIPGSIGDLKRLQELVMSGVEQVERLPASVSSLQNLTPVSIYGCEALRQVEPLMGLTQLEELSLLGCESLWPLRRALTGLVSLRSLEVDCPIMGEEGAELDLSTLQQLRSVVIKPCDGRPREHFAFVTDIISKLGQLRMLDVWCSCTLSLPQGITSLQHLDVHVNGCCSLLHIPQGYSSMRGISPKSRRNLRERLERLQRKEELSARWLPGSMGSLLALRSLELRDSQQRELPADIGVLLKLAKFTMKSCHCITALPASFSSLERLESLVIRKCRSLQTLCGGLSSLVTLESFVVEDCSLLERIESLEGCTKLKSVRLHMLCSPVGLPVFHRSMLENVSFGRR